MAGGRTLLANHRSGGSPRRRTSCAPAAAPSAAPEPTASAKATKEKGYSSVIAANTKLLNAGLFNPPEKGEGLPQVTRTDFEALYTAHTAEFKRLYKALVTSNTTVNFAEEIKKSFPNATPDDLKRIKSCMRLPIGADDLKAVKERYKTFQEFYNANKAGTVNFRDHITYTMTFTDKELEDYAKAHLGNAPLAGEPLNELIQAQMAGDQLRGFVEKGDPQAPDSNKITAALNSLVKQVNGKDDKTQLRAYEALFSIADPKKQADEAAKFLAAIPNDPPAHMRDVLRWNLAAPATKDEREKATKLFENFNPKDEAELNAKLKRDLGYDPSMREHRTALDIYAKIKDKQGKDRADALATAVAAPSLADVLEKLGTQIGELIEKLTKFFNGLFKDKKGEKKEAETTTTLKAEKSPIALDAGKKLEIAKDFTATNGKGVDITTTPNQEISAVAAGKVTKVDAANNTVTLKAGPDSIVYTGISIDAANIKKSADIKAGDKLGTALVTSVNFARFNEKNEQVDPSDYLRDFMPAKAAEPVAVAAPAPAPEKKGHKAGPAKKAAAPEEKTEKKVEKQESPIVKPDMGSLLSLDNGGTIQNPTANSFEVKLPGDAGVIKFTNVTPKIDLSKVTTLTPSQVVGVVDKADATIQVIATTEVGKKVDFSTIVRDNLTARTGNNMVVLLKDKFKEPAKPAQ